MLFSLYIKFIVIDAKLKSYFILSCEVSHKSQYWLKELLVLLFWEILSLCPVPQMVFDYSKYKLTHSNYTTMLNFKSLSYNVEFLSPLG